MSRRNKKSSQRAWVCFLLGALILAACPVEVLAQANSSVTKAPETTGQRDFDFEFGSWSAHLRRLLHPLTGSNTWVEYDGISTVQKVWDGRANLGEFKVDGPGGHIQGLSLRLYNPESRQWRISWAGSSDGRLTTPMVGLFKDGRGQFYDQETFHDKAIFARFIFSDITPNSFRLEQAFSADGGKTWEPNWIVNFTRLKQ